MSHRNRIYLDNAATSWPKPEGVVEAVENYLRENGTGYGRAASGAAGDVQQQIEGLRRSLKSLIGATSNDQLLFAYSGTDALNIVLHGVLRPGDHVVTTAAEHNSILRPLHWLEQQHGIETTIVRADSQGAVSAEAVIAAVRDDTRLVALTHASNVTGLRQPVEEVGQALQSIPTLLLVDAAQTLGHVPIDVQSLCCDLLAAPGHKGLLGPLGTGVLYVRESVTCELRTFRQGGTGSSSDLDQEPSEWPERMEAGNHNVPGLVGLAAAIQYLELKTIERIGEHVQDLVRQLWQGLSRISGVTLYGSDDRDARVGIVSANLKEYAPHEAALALESVAAIEVRSGFHCAPRMHAALGTASEGGTVRFSCGHATTPEEINAAVTAVQALMS